MVSVGGFLLGPKTKSLFFIFTMGIELTVFFMQSGKKHCQYFPLLFQMEGW